MGLPWGMPEEPSPPSIGRSGLSLELEERRAVGTGRLPRRPPVGSSRSRRLAPKSEGVGRLLAL